MRSFDLINKRNAVRRMNQWGRERKPFFFLISFDEEHCIVCPPEELPVTEFLFNYNGQTNEKFGILKEKFSLRRDVKWHSFPEPYEQYQKSFDIAHKNLLLGNSFLLNLTCQTPVSTNLSLKDIYFRSKAKYKLWWKNHFTMFSPEIFVQIKRGGLICTFPMKGTIAADMPEAESCLMSDKKEAAEHATITDLLRNDLSQVASQVRVERYRYVDRLLTHKGILLQTSSEIRGQLPEDFYDQLGTIFFKLLPAGSITGAPKKKTVEIIREAEDYDRGFYTGVTGYFDGEELDSAVVIRFVEKGTTDLLYFKSGGGITFQSDCRKEYEEMIEKVYVPIY